MSKVAVVTGVSHTHGIGAAICRKLAETGTAIFFAHWQAEAEWPKQFQAELENMGVSAGEAEIDLAEPEAYSQLLDDVTAQLGFPNILVNNAAYSTRDGYQKLDASDLDAHYAVNMRTTFLLCTEFARRLEAGDKSAARIINMTSGQQQGPMQEELAYVATKGAISAFTLSLSAEVASLGITVNAVNPGPTDTGWMTEELKKELIPKFLLGRMGQPGDAARLVAFLASEEAGWITGQVINSEGGFLRQ
ncbi:SDR family oxidoreductase [Lentibacillus sediminis]|uniref:SDR family oxidoreductase n=1 Tax=Lentibacillus sediminis TaxID=1940529 RepID=UPI000C1BC363|nr:SDR family oxidoreductase [Lentibacillus sediminis]